MGHVDRTGEIINIYKSLVRKPEETSSFSRLKRRSEENIKMDL
jgi:hypothetical protein